MPEIALYIFSCISGFLVSYGGLVHVNLHACTKHKNLRGFEIITGIKNKFTKIKQKVEMSLPKRTDTRVVAIPQY